MSGTLLIENSFYSYAELTEEQKIRFAAYQVFDMPKKASSNIKDTDTNDIAKAKVVDGKLEAA